MINAPHESPLGMVGQREGDLEQHVVQPLRGPWLRLELWDLGSIRNAFAEREGGVEVRVPRERDPPTDRERVELPVVLCPEMLGHLPLHFEADVFAELRKLP